MNDNERDKLWDLLGKARQPEVSPFFARNVLRELRHSRENRRAPWWRALHGMFRPAGALAAAVALAVVIGGIHFRNQSLPHTNQTVAADQITEEDISVVVDLDELLASQDTSLWLQSESSQ